MEVTTLKNTQTKVIRCEKKTTETVSSIHLTADFYEPQFIENPKEIRKILYNAAQASNNTPLKCAIHKFPVCGITGVIILAESHISIHTWPEHNYLALDIFTCGKHSQPEKALEYLKSVFRPRWVKVQYVERGQV